MQPFELEMHRNNLLFGLAAGMVTPEQANRAVAEQSEPDDFTEICSQCGNAHDDDALRCPACGFAFLDDEHDSAQGVYNRPGLYHRGRDLDLKRIEESAEIDAINRSLK